MDTPEILTTHSLSTAPRSVRASHSLMAGYSKTPLPKKLGIKPGHRLTVVGAPDDFFATTLTDLPDTVTVRTTLRSREPSDVLLFFVSTRARLLAAFDRCTEKLDVEGGLWVCWPKKASKVPSDITEDVVRQLALSRGLVDNKVCAVDETWSGLRCVFRVANREAIRRARAR